MNAIYRWLARRLPMTLVKLCAIRALDAYVMVPASSTYDPLEMQHIARLVREWAGNAAVDF